MVVKKKGTLSSSNVSTQQKKNLIDKDAKSHQKKSDEGENEDHGESNNSMGCTLEEYFNSKEKYQKDQMKELIHVEAKDAMIMEKEVVKKSHQSVSAEAKNEVDQIEEDDKHYEEDYEEESQEAGDVSVAGLTLSEYLKGKSSKDTGEIGAIATAKEQEDIDESETITYQDAKAEAKTNATPESSAAAAQMGAKSHNIKVSEDPVPFVNGMSLDMYLGASDYQDEIEQCNVIDPSAPTSSMIEDQTMRSSRSFESKHVTECTPRGKKKSKVHKSHHKSKASARAADLVGHGHDDEGGMHTKRKKRGAVSKHKKSSSSSSSSISVSKSILMSAESSPSSTGLMLHLSKGTSSNGGGNGSFKKNHHDKPLPKLGGGGAGGGSRHEHIEDYSSSSSNGSHLHQGSGNSDKLPRIQCK
jgi:hypothetical protein